MIFHYFCDGFLEHCGGCNIVFREFKVWPICVQIAYEDTGSNYYELWTFFNTLQAQIQAEILLGNKCITLQ